MGVILFQYVLFFLLKFFMVEIIHGVKILMVFLFIEAPEEVASSALFKISVSWSEVNF